MNVTLAGGLTRPTVTFWGAAHAVTGSMHLLEVGGRKLLLDCGRVMGPRWEARRRAVRFPFPAYAIDAVILSHAHLDHCGNLPFLVRQGFTGPIYCTPPTRDLVGLMLGDSADRQEEDARVLRFTERDPIDDGDVPILLSREDVARTLRQCVPLRYGASAEVLPGVTARLFDAGHLLGSAMVSLTIRQDGRERRVTFTGDLGRTGVPLLRDPAAVPDADLIVSECTYGGRFHPPWEKVLGELAEAVTRTAARGGKVLIPSFALGRTQVVVACLRRAMRAGTIPELPIYVDSPLSADIAEVYRRYPDYLDAEARLRLEVGDDPIDDGVRYAYTPAESEALAQRREVCVIVAPSAMCDGGRITRHLKQNIDDPRCSIVLVSYQAPDSLGRRLKEPRPTVRFHGRDWNLWAEVVDLNGFSGHADQNDFVRALAPLAGRARQVRLVHGEPEAAAALEAALRDVGFDDVAAPRPGEAVVLP